MRQSGAMPTSISSGVFADRFGSVMYPASAAAALLRPHTTKVFETDLPERFFAVTLIVCFPVGILRSSVTDSV